MGNFIFWKMRRHMITKDYNNNTKNYVIKSAILQSHFLPNRNSQMLMCELSLESIKDLTELLK